MTSLSAFASLIALPVSNAGRPSLIGWIRRKQAERRQRIAQENLVAQLCARDRRLLEDIDIDPDLLASDAVVAVSRQNPHILAASMFADCFRRSGDR